MELGVCLAAHEFGMPASHGYFHVVAVAWGGRGYVSVVLAEAIRLVHVSFFYHVVLRGGESLLTRACVCIMYCPMVSCARGACQWVYVPVMVVYLPVARRSRVMCTGAAPIGDRRAWAICAT